MRFQINDIVSSSPNFRPAVFVITGIEAHRPKNPYTGVSLVNGKTYRLSEESLASKRLGVADADWNKTKLPDGDSTVDQNYIKGARRARMELEVIGGLSNDDRKRWEILANLKTGDKVRCKVRGEFQNLAFKHCTDRGYKYVFVAQNEKGTVYKYPLSVVMV